MKFLSKISNILFGVGFNTGRLRISSEEYRAIKNAYVAPTLYFTPRLIIKRIVISLRGEYQFDVTKKNWQPILLSKKQKGLEVDDLRQTGLILNFCLSWKF